MSKNMVQWVEKKVSSMSATELRLTAAAAEEELTLRRHRWVQDHYARCYQQECAGMAAVQECHKPHRQFCKDRVVVTCFKNKDRTKVSVGIARLTPGDRYDYETGVAIAFARAMGEEIPDLF